MFIRDNLGVELPEVLHFRACGLCLLDKYQRRRQQGSLSNIENGYIFNAYTGLKEFNYENNASTDFTLLMTVETIFVA